MIAISESRKSRRNSVRYPVNAGYNSPRNGLLLKDAISGIPYKFNPEKLDIKLIEKNSSDAPQRSGISINSPEMIALENSITAPVIPEEAIEHIRPTPDRLAEKHRAHIRREDERIQYGPLAPRIKKQKAAVRKPKLAGRGTSAANPFLGQRY